MRIQSSRKISYQASITARIDYHKTIIAALDDRQTILRNALNHLSMQATTLTDAALLLVKTLSGGQKVLLAGNGGSAAQAQHCAAELVGRFKRERVAFAALALSTDSAILTAVANDYGYHDVFARQIQALGQPGDVFLAFSTSGESENLIRAAEMGHQCGINVIAITGCEQSSIEKLADITICAPGIDTATAQELHMIIIHILCDLVETRLVMKQNGVDEVEDACVLVPGQQEEK